MKEVSPIILVDDIYGVNIPHIFASEYLKDPEPGWSGIDELSEGCIGILLRGPDHEHYWECWEEVLEGVSYYEFGMTYVLLQDMDLFLVQKAELLAQSRWEVH